MLVITVKNEDVFSVTHGGQVVWVQIKKHKGKFRLYIDGPTEILISRPDKHGSETPPPEGFDRLFSNGNRGRN